MKSSHGQSSTGVSPESLSKTGELFPLESFAGPGSLDDGAVVRSIITESIRRCAKSRDAIADEMSSLTGDRVTVRMLNSYTSNAAEQHRFPAQYLRAFCHSSGDWRLLRCIAERAGFQLISNSEVDLLELGRQYLRQKRAAEQAALLEKRLSGVDL